MLICPCERVGHRGVNSVDGYLDRGLCNAGPGRFLDEAERREVAKERYDLVIFVVRTKILLKAQHMALNIPRTVSTRLDRNRARFCPHEFLYDGGPFLLLKPSDMNVSLPFEVSNCIHLRIHD